MMQFSPGFGLLTALAAMVLLATACRSEPEQGLATTGPLVTRDWAIERGERQVVNGSAGVEPATPHHAVARLVSWSVFKQRSSFVPHLVSGGGYDEPEPDGPVWIVQMGTELPEDIGTITNGQHIFPMVVLDAVSGLQVFVIWSTEPLILPTDYFDPEERLGPLQYVVEPSRISHEEAIELILERGNSLSPVTPLRGSPDLNRATADQVRYSPAERLGWLLTLPYEPRLDLQAGAFTALGTQPPRPTEWANVLYAILDDNFGLILDAGTDQNIGPVTTQAQYSAIFTTGRDSGWWRLWDQLRTKSYWQIAPIDTVVEN